uniref:Uncharacterized protein n=1 Tax=Kalanchoe fedtschenkoi TaxID=63787 RepID=A0A7N0V9T8_KALFE
MISQIVENGCSLLPNCSPVPKYKRRKISAVRDFPYGCGPNAPKINVRPTKGSCAGHGDHVQRSIDEVKIEPKLDIHTAAAHEFLQLKDELAKSPNEVSINSFLDKTILSCVHSFPVQPEKPTYNFNNSVNNSGRNYPPRRKISAIRDFPPFCGRDAPRLMKDECIKVRASSQHGSASQNVVENMDVKSRELDGVGKEIVLYDAKNEVSDHDAKMLAFDDVVGKEIIVRSEGCGLRGQLLESCENSANRLVVHALTAEPNYNEIAVHKEGEHLRSEHVLVNAVDREIVHALTAASRSKESGVELENNYSRSESSYENGVNDAVVYGLMAAPKCPWRQSKAVIFTSVRGIHKSRLKLGSSSVMKKSKVRKLLEERRALKAASKTKKSRQPNYIEATPLRSRYPNAMEMDSWEVEEDRNSFYVNHRSHDIDLPPVVPSNAKLQKDSNDCVSYNKVRETLRLFQAVFRKLMHEEEAILRRGETASKRVDLLTAKFLKDQGKYINTGKQIVGSVPGVDVGFEFQFRVELAIVGLHRLYQAGIDYMKKDGSLIATSVVASGGYADDMDSADVLIYSGSGGNPTKGDKKAEDQKLERGNLALKNSVTVKNPVRVIRGHDHKISDGRTRTVKTYTYDGLYVVTAYWQKPGPNGNLVYMFRLERIPGQPELAWNVIKKSKVRHGVCTQDISEGKELIPICAVNTIDDQKPPFFKYITSMLYPDWCRPLPLRGCNCVGGCTDSASCSCALRNGGEIPFNNNGSIVEVKPLVYECGPSCKCPPTCPNRVSQFGVRFQLEIFKTEARGWGVRSLNYIPSGSFICEYLGELLEDRQAEQRIGNDEYLFDIGSSFSDRNLLDEFPNIMPHLQIGPSEVVDDVGFTIDAERYGNVGRFINHSCSPNLYAQNVLYDHEDRRIPHIMLFAAENIPALQELTYHYNYNIGEVRDVNGNVKVKHCFCGSAECIGRLY